MESKLELRYKLEYKNVTTFQGQLSFKQKHNCNLSLDVQSVCCH